MNRLSRPLQTHAPRRQRGAALLLAMIILTLIATLSISMVWQQWRAVQVEAAERARAQSAWILSGALDWAGLILREDGRGRNRVDHLGEPWAVPLAEARLSTFLALDKQNTDESGPEAFLSGSISDAQARFNLNNLVDGTGKPSVRDVQSLQRLCENLNVSAAVADQLAISMQAAVTAGKGASAPVDAPLQPRRVSQLSWLGIDAQAIQRLEPHVVLLPARTTVNVNTASREVIAAVIPGLNVGDAERLVQIRQRTPFNQVSEVLSQVGSQQTQQQPLDGIGVDSSYFEVRGRLRLDDRVLEQRSLVYRDRNRPIVVLTSERVSSSDSQPLRP